MTQISKFYDDSKKASAALAELKAAKYDNAEMTADGKGGGTVTVDPPFGKGGVAETILKRHGPTRDAYVSGGSSHSGSTRDYDSRTTFGGIFPELTNPNFFLSTMFGPLLASPEPYSSLSPNQKPFSSLTKSQKPFSSLASNQKGWATLINNPAPFSSMLGLPVLSKR